MSRNSSVERNTKETQIKINLNLDGTGISKLESGIGFLDHMLDQIARHGLIDLEVRVRGVVCIQVFGRNLVFAFYFGESKFTLTVSRPNPKGTPL